MTQDGKEGRAGNPERRSGQGRDGGGSSKGKGRDKDESREAVGEAEGAKGALTAARLKANWVAHRLVQKKDDPGRKGPGRADPSRRDV